MQKRSNQLLDHFRQKLNLPDIVARMSDDFISNRRPLLQGHLMDSIAVDKINIDSLVFCRSGVIFALKSHDDVVELLFHGKEIQFPKSAELAIRHVLDREKVTPGELPDNLDESSKLVLVRRLIREGFLTLSDQAT